MTGGVTVVLERKKLQLVSSSAPDGAPEDWLMKCLIDVPRSVAMGNSLSSSPTGSSLGSKVHERESVCTARAQNGIYTSKMAAAREKRFLEWS